MKTKYEYDVVVNDGGVFDLTCNTRAEARQIKNSWIKSEYKAKIVQRKYVLQEQREIR
jgi:hypothetical protein